MIDLNRLAHSKLLRVAAFVAVVVILVFGIKSCVNEKAAYKDLENSNKAIEASKQREEELKLKLAETDKRATYLEGELKGAYTALDKAQNARAEQTIKVEASQQNLNRALSKKVVRVKPEEKVSDAEAIEAYEKGINR